MGADQMGDPRGLIMLSPKVSATPVKDNQNLLAIGGFGVAYHCVDVDACTAADVVVYLTVGTVNPVVAKAALESMIKVTHHMRIKDRQLRDAQ